MSTSHFAGNTAPFNSHNNPKKEVGTIFISAGGETEEPKSDRTFPKSHSG